MMYLNRQKIYQKVDAAKDAKKVYIFCEGKEREIGYFNYFKGISTNIDIIPIPPVDGQSDPEKLKLNAELLFLGDKEKNILPTHKLIDEFNDEVWFAIDTDLWEEHGKIDVLREFCKDLNKGKICWNIAQSNPCFEIWLLYHLSDQIPLKQDVDKCSSFKEYVGKKVTGGVDVRKVPIHLKEAIVNSKSNYSLVNGKPALFATEMHNLGEIILSFVSEQLVKAQKMIAESIKGDAESKQSMI